MKESKISSRAIDGDLLPSQIRKLALSDQLGEEVFDQDK